MRVPHNTIFTQQRYSRLMADESKDPRTDATIQVMDTFLVIPFLESLNNITIHFGSCPTREARKSLPSEEVQNTNDIGLKLETRGVATADHGALISGFPRHPMYFV